MARVKDDREKIILVSALFVLSALVLWQWIENTEHPDPQGYKCKHGNAPGACLICWLEKQKPPHE